MKTLTIIGFFVAFASYVSAQSSRIAGRIIDVDGHPIVGVALEARFGSTEPVSVLSRGDGSFTINIVGAEVTLKTKHIGYLPYQATLTSPFPDSLRIVLPTRVNQLEEVEVATGYQKLEKATATGSFELIGNETFNSRFSTDPITRLDGLVPGLLFGRSQLGTLGSNNYQIRGMSTLTQQSGVNRPLVVVDNFPYEGDILNINPNDVLNVTVLKDAAASSIWGAKAGNGVLVITTKGGEYNGPLKIAVSGTMGVTEKPDLLHTPQMSVSDFIDVEAFLFEQGAYNSVLNNTTTWPVLTPVVELLARVRNGKLAESEAIGHIDRYRTYDLRNQVDRHINRLSVNRQFHASISGGNKWLNQYLSIGRDDNRGSTIGSQNDRTTILSRSAFNFARKLSLELGLTYNRRGSTDNTPEITNGVTAGQSVYPYARLVDEFGNALILERDRRLGYADTAGSGLLQDWHYRPMEEANYLDNSSASQHFRLDASARYQIFKPLEMELRYNLEYGNTQNRNYHNLQTYEARNLVNRFSQITDGQISYGVPLGGLLDQGSSSLTAQAFRAQLNFDENWHEHKLTTLIGGEIREKETLSSAYRTFGYDDDLMTYQLVDFVNRLPLYGGTGTEAVNPQTSFSGYLDRFISFYGNASYDYRRRYIVSASARKDASNLFGVSTNNKWKPLWSAGVAWNMSEEPFYRWEAIPFLKVRATYGYSGNVNNSVAAVTTISYNRNLSSLGRQRYAILQNPPNPGLRWEQVATTNIGVDFSGKDARVTGSIELYRKKSTDLVSSVSIDGTTGYSTLDMNVASLMNRGIDMSLNTINLAGSIRWQSRFYMSYNDDRVLEYFVDRRTANLYINNGRTLSPMEDRPIFPVVSYTWGGLDPNTGEPQGYIDGALTKDYQGMFNQQNTDGLTFHGSGVPQWHGALGNTLNYRNFSLSLDITYRLGYYFRRSSVSYYSLYNGRQAAHGDYYHRWQNPGDEKYTDVPAAIYPANSRSDQFYEQSSVLIERGDHIRLQNVNLFYQITKHELPVLPVEKLELKLMLNNVALLWKANKKGLDPDFTTYPARKNIVLGVKINF